MGFRYSKRVKLGGGLGLNLSKSGVSASYRTKYGSIGPRGFSVRTGIPGLTFRGGRRKRGEAAIIVLMIMLAYFVVSVAAVVIWNGLRFTGWAAIELYHFALRKKREYDIRKVEPVTETIRPSFLEARNERADEDKTP